MSLAQDQIAFTSIGIQRILPTTGTSRRITKRNPEDDRDTEAGTQSKDESPLPHPPGTGSLVDKAV